jgi:hypothetical protein
MAEGIATQLKEAPKKFLTAPVMAIAIGLMFTLVVLVIEAKKPGILTDKLRALLHKVNLA